MLLTIRMYRIFLTLSSANSKIRIKGFVELFDGHHQRATFGGASFLLLSVIGDGVIQSILMASYKLSLSHFAEASVFHVVKHIVELLLTVYLVVCQSCIIFCTFVCIDSIVGLIARCCFLRWFHYKSGVKEKLKWS